jgi:hypothetical protein
VSGKTPRLILAVGIVMIFTGMIGAVVLYMDMREQRHLHDSVAGITFSLGKAADWQQQSFSIIDSGYYTLYLATSSRNPAPVSLHGAGLYHGTFEAQILDSSKNMLWQRAFGGPEVAIVPPPNTVWTYLDSAQLHLRGEESCILRIRVTGADTAFSKTSSELIIMPPQAFDIGVYIYGQALKLLGMGVLVLAGFFVMILGGYLQKRKGSVKIFQPARE